MEYEADLEDRHVDLRGNLLKVMWVGWRSWGEDMLTGDRMILNWLDMLDPDEHKRADREVKA